MPQHPQNSYQGFKGCTFARFKILESADTDSSLCSYSLLIHILAQSQFANTLTEIQLDLFYGLMSCYLFCDGLHKSIIAIKIAIKVIILFKSHIYIF